MGGWIDCGRDLIDGRVDEWLYNRKVSVIFAVGNDSSLVGTGLC